MAWVLAAAPWWALAGGMSIDEFYFHRRRGLPRWERIGHPVDTAAMLGCFLLALLAPPTGSWLRAYGALALASMLLVTKDEAVHAERCAAGELRLHAALFMLHPLALLSALAAWLAPSGRLAALGLAAAQAADLRRALAAQAALSAVFLAYQVAYWNL